MVWGKKLWFGGKKLWFRGAKISKIIRINYKRKKLWSKGKNYGQWKKLWCNL